MIYIPDYEYTYSLFTYPKLAHSDAINRFEKYTQECFKTIIEL